ncbi:MAG: right-handed parallel beta-helix repeat-containing protein, partial [Candidatus Kariarchaeaceae archaeon]
QSQARLFLDYITSTRGQSRVGKFRTPANLKATSMDPIPLAWDSLGNPSSDFPIISPYNVSLDGKMFSRTRSLFTNWFVLNSQTQTIAWKTMSQVLNPNTRETALTLYSKLPTNFDGTIGSLLSLDYRNSLVTSLWSNEGANNFNSALSFPFNSASPISINGNAEFSGFPGSGTQVNPYRIEGFNITGSNGILISITDTDVHFRISSNLLNGLGTADTGIWLNNVENGIIEYNTVYNTNGNGIDLYSSRYNTIRENSACNNPWAGISLHESSLYNFIFNNTLFNNEWTGIVLDLSNSNNISSNEIFNNQWSGIVLQNSSINTLNNNSVYNNNPGIQISNSTDNVISRNNVFENDWTGIHLENSSNNTVQNNNIDDNERYGIRSLDSTDNSINDNRLTNNGFYISGLEIDAYLQKSMQNNFVNDKLFIYWVNKIGGNVPINVGPILLVNCSYITVTNQNLSKSGQGISVVFSSNIIIRNNVIQNSRVGISLGRFTKESLVTNNTLLENRVMDIWLFSSENNNISYNSIISNNHKMFSSIALSDSKNNLIINNIIYSYEGPNIWLEYTTSADIIGETSSNNIVKLNDFKTKENVEFQAIDDGVDNLFEQNYWNDWNGKDPYVIGGTAGNQDLEPLNNPFHLSKPDIEIQTSGNIFENDQVMVQWNPSMDLFNHQIAYSIFYSSNNGESWINLISELKTTSMTFGTDNFPNDVKILIKVQAVDSLGFISETISDSTFKIWTKLTEPTILYP